jgi:hypothetical protein
MKNEKPDSSNEPPEFFHNSSAKYIPPELLPGDDGVTFAKCELCNKGDKDIARMFRIISEPCWNCGKSIKLAFVEIDEMEVILPDQFTPLERELAAQRGVYLKKCRNCMEPGGYANFCGFCKKPTDYFGIIKLVGFRDPECNIVSGYECSQCNADHDDSEED